MAQLTMDVSLAQLNALGGVTSDSIDFTSALPAGARIINMSARNKGTAFASSGGTVANLNVNITASGQTTTLAGGGVHQMQTASYRGQNNVLMATGMAAAVYPFESGFTPAAKFTVSGAGVTLGNLTDGDDGIEVTITYL